MLGYVSSVTDIGVPRYLQKPIVQMRSFLNFFEISSSSTRSCWRSSRKTSVKPLIFTPFMELNMAVVAAIRLSMASSHMA